MDPITVSKIEGNGVTLVSKIPLTFIPKFDNDVNHWFVELDEIDLYCFGEDRTDLLECIHDFISYDWISYVMYDDTDLDSSTLSIKKSLADMFTQES